MSNKHQLSKVQRVQVVYADAACCHSGGCGTTGMCLAPYLRAGGLDCVAAGWLDILAAAATYAASGSCVEDAWAATGGEQQGKTDNVIMLPLALSCGHLRLWLYSNLCGIAFAP